MARAMMIVALVACIACVAGCGSLKGLLVNVERAPETSALDVEKAKVSALEARTKALEERIAILEAKKPGS